MFLALKHLKNKFAICYNNHKGILCQSMCQLKKLFPLEIKNKGSAKLHLYEVIMIFKCFFLSKQERCIIICSNQYHKDNL